jgi:hypothetical protein
MGESRNQRYEGQEFAFCIESNEFLKEHIRWNSRNEKAGGPKDPAMLFSMEEIEADFDGLDVKLLEEQDVKLDGGLLHFVTAATIRLVGKKY